MSNHAQPELEARALASIARVRPIAEAHARALTRIATSGEPVFNQGVALYVEDLKVAFDGFQALGGLSFTVGVGELRCVIGPNGAGKTTTMDCITGKTRPDSGRIYFGSNLDLRQMNEQQIARAGIGRKFQKPTVFEPANWRWPATAAQGSRCAPGSAAYSATAWANC